MKKLLLAAVTGLAFGCVSAQSIQIQDINNVPITNGFVWDEWYDVSASAPYVDFPVKNISGSSKSIKMMRHIVSEVNGTSNVICWLACYAPSQGTSPVVNVPSNTTHTFTSHYYPMGNLGTTTIWYTFWDSLNPADSAWFTIRWHITPAGVKDINPSVTVSNIYPNPASTTTTISYQLNNVENGLVKIYNVVGEEVKRFAIMTKEGNFTFSVADLEPGIYFCSFLDNDKILATRKITVTH